MRAMLLVMTCLLLVPGLVLAERTVTVTPLDQGLIQGLSLGAPAQCRMGNLNTPYWAVGGWLYGNEEYKYLFYPPDYQCCPAEQGFLVDSVHMVLQFSGAPTFDVYVDLEDAVWDPTTGCWVPGVEDCVSPVYTVTIPEAGAYDIGLPLAEQCACAYQEYWYFVSFHFVTTFQRPPDLITDNVPVGCTSYNNWGEGWQDLVNDQGFPGELAMWADVACCDSPVQVDDTTWGRVKSLYR